MWETEGFVRRTGARPGLRRRGMRRERRACRALCGAPRLTGVSGWRQRRAKTRLCALRAFLCGRSGAAVRLQMREGAGRSGPLGDHRELLFSEGSDLAQSRKIHSLLRSIIPKKSRLVNKRLTIFGNNL